MEAIVWILAWALVFAAPVGAPPPEPTGRVTEVVVFPDRAAVTREAVVSLAPGTNEVVFRDLPPTLDPDTLLAHGLGVGGTIRGLSVARRELAEDRRERVAVLQDRLDGLRDRRRERLDDKAAAEAEGAFLGALSAAAAAQLSAELLFAPGVPADADALAALVRTRTAAVLADVRAADVALRDLAAEIEAVERELRAVRGAPQWARTDVTVLVDAEAAGEATVGLTYTVPGASWTPAWDVRATPGDAEVAMSLSARVIQTTGEDWRDVSLVLSTARPAGGVTPPVLTPLWLAPSDPGIVPVGVARSDGGAPRTAGVLEGEADFWDDAEMPVDAADPSPMDVALAGVEARPVATTFTVPGRATVPGDGRQRRVAVAEAEVPAEWTHVVVPADDERAWVVAACTWTPRWPLLPGRVSVFVEDAYVGAMALPAVGSGGRFEVGFGPDDAVRVDRVVVEDLRRGPGPFGRVTVTRTWRTTVANGREAPVAVSVRDRLPVSTDRRWRVVPVGDPPTVVEDEGRRRWDVDLPAGGEVAVTAGWSLRYPRRHPPGGFR